MGANDRKFGTANRVSRKGLGLALALLGGLLCGAAALADDVKEGDAINEEEIFDDSASASDEGFLCVEKDGALIVVGLSKASTNLDLPDEIDGKPVLEIQEGAFEGRSFERVVLPDSLKKIGARAFSGCDLPTFLELPDEIAEIGADAFRGATGVEIVKLPKKLAELGEGAFAETSDLTAFEISPKAKSFKAADGVLFDKRGRALVAYPAAKSDRETYAVPRGVKAIGSRAFSGNETLVAISLPSSLESFDFAALPSSANFKALRFYGGVSNLDLEAIASESRAFSIEIASKKGRYCSCDGALFDRKTKTLAYLPKSEETTYRVPDGTKRISVAPGSNIEGVYIPASVKQIDSFFLTSGYQPASIFAPKGSYAETFARENGCAFYAMSNPEDFPPDGFEKEDETPGSFESKLGAKMRLEGVTFNETPFNWRAYRGHWVLIDFWTTWCGFCTSEIPFNRAVYQYYARFGFEIVGVNCDEDLDKLAEFAMKNPLPWTNISTQMTKESGYDFLDVKKFYRVSGYPTMILVDPQGRIVDTNARGEHLLELLAEAFPDVPVPPIQPARR